jgi:hypothetical protein
MDPRVKEAFERVKEDISVLSKEIYTLALQNDSRAKSVDDLKEYVDSQISIFSVKNDQLVRQGIDRLSAQIGELALKLDKVAQITPQPLSVSPSAPSMPQNPAVNEQIPTSQLQTPTNPTVLEPLKELKLGFSTGNRGVPTDRQTDQQTDQQTHFPSILPPSSNKNDFDEAVRILDSLDGIKKEIRRKFKLLTPMEMEVFSLLYSLEENGEEADYRLLASKLGLSESSIRDYTAKIMSKGIPITKEKIHNKKVLLKVSGDLKRITNLDTILRLREL